MPELRNNPSPSDSTVEQPSQVPHGYRITRKGSRYNIIGPEGRIFTKNKSASVAGPRWEELTHTPWPHPSSAYEPGLRLWELGIISREDITNNKPVSAPVKTKAEAATAKAAAKEAPAKAAPAKAAPAKAAKKSRTRKAPKTKPAKATKSGSPAKPATPVAKSPAPAPKPVALTTTLLALPAPKINLAQQTQIITALRKNPSLLFRPEVRDALKHEVDYHRPYAAWAANLLKVLARYDARHRSHVKPAPIKQETIMARHIAWQEHQLQQQVAVNH